MPEANIITGQYVQISQSPASLGERIVAQIIDDFLIICYLVGVTLLIAELNLTFFSNELFLTRIKRILRILVKRFLKNM